MPTLPIRNIFRNLQPNSLSYHESSEDATRICSGTFARAALLATKAIIVDHCAVTFEGAKTRLARLEMVLNTLTIAIGDTVTFSNGGWFIPDHSLLNEDNQKTYLTVENKLSYYLLASTDNTLNIDENFSLTEVGPRRTAEQVNVIWHSVALNVPIYCIYQVFQQLRHSGINIGLLTGVRNGTWICARDNVEYVLN